MLVTKTSLLSGVSHTLDINVSSEQLVRIKTELVQKVVPHLSAEDREFLISGVTPEEWNREFGNDENI